MDTISIQSFQVPNSRITVHSDLDGVDKKKVNLAEKRANFLVDEFKIENNLKNILSSLNKHYYEGDSYIVSLSVETRKKKHLALKLSKNQKQIVSVYLNECDIILENKYWADMK
ncbi:hypothetical protein HNP86_001592 [Methanococcus maripaludis]|uniref:Uncharacterized protein n=1 Tax=Methanococcus maripaludis TaxID=39152 RepID=A0A7J9NUT6_METMI|nr:hypothetical protein [Methanococcus maripaludis]MBA2851439.1 hypothetical protein [Methanococcus maripaludis]